MAGRKPPRERALAHMRRLALASASLGACHPHHDPVMNMDEYMQPHQASDPVVPPAERIPPDEPTAPAPNAAGNVRVETAWLNDRQLVVHIVSNERLLVPSITSKSRSVETTTGAVPHLKPSGATSPPVSAQRDTHALPPIAAVQEAVASSPTERWILLRELVPNEEIVLSVGFAGGGTAEPFSLQIPPVLGGPVQATRSP